MGTNIFKSILEGRNLPKSYELKELTLLGSPLAFRTRYFDTNGKDFISSKSDFESATWSFTSIEKDFPEVAAVCTELTKATGKRVQCNAYFTPSNKQGLPAHYDLHDVYVIQVEGEKIWSVWTPFRHQVSIQTLILDEHENLPNWTKSPAQLTALTSGHCLFIKAGVPHECVATDSDSFHLTFGVYHD